MNAVLFVTTAVVWGSSWIGIKLQVDGTPVLTSIFYRFALSGLILLMVVLILRRLTVPAWSHQPYVLACGLSMFSINYIFMYHAAGFISSGLIAVVFSLTTVFNAFNARLFLAEPLTIRIISAALLGSTGLACLFAPQMDTMPLSDLAMGLLLSCGGTYCFSLGNMASRHLSAHDVPPFTANAWGMCYGSLIILTIMLITDTPVIVTAPSTPYILSLLYLAAFSTIIGFTTYLMMVARMGAAQAAYVTVLFPIIALGLSTIFEGYQWTWINAIGLALALMGNVVMFGKARQTEHPANS